MSQVKNPRPGGSGTRRQDHVLGGRAPARGHGTEGRLRTARLIECRQMDYIGDRPSSVLKISRFHISAK